MRSVPKRLFSYEPSVHQYSSRKNGRAKPGFIASLVVAKPVQLPRLLLGFKHSVIEEGNFAGWLKDPVIVCGKLLAALREINTLVAKVEISILCTTNDFVEVLPRAHDRQ